MSGLTTKAIERKIRPFCDPKYTKMHGRPIYHDVAKACDLPTELCDLHAPVWKVIWDLYIRLDAYCMRQASKIIETANDLYTAPLPRFEAS